MRLVAQCHDLGARLRYPAAVILLLGDTVDDVLLHATYVPRLVHGTDNVDLVILPWVVAPVDVNDVVRPVDPEHGIGGVPVDVVDVGGGGGCRHQLQEQGEDGGGRPPR